VGVTCRSARAVRRARSSAAGRVKCRRGPLGEVVSARTHARTAGGRARSSAVSGGVMRCHPGLRSPVRQGTMRGHALMVMSVRTAMDVAVPGWMQRGLPARPSSLVGLNGGGTGRSDLRHWEQLQANACLGSRVVGVSRRRGRPDNGSQVMVLRLSGTRTRPGHVRARATAMRHGMASQRLA
jgi:hypothetical protein